LSQSCPLVGPAVTNQTIEPEKIAMPRLRVPTEPRRITVGVDTHKDIHVAVALDHLGVRLAELHVRTTLAGYTRLERWATNLGIVEAFGIEGTGSYGAGLARFLRARHHRLLEVNRPDRATRRRLGKSDPIDAEMAARLVLAGVATGIPKAGDGPIEMLRMLKLAKDSAVKTRTQSLNQIKALLVTAPAELRETLTGLPRGQLVDRCAAFRPGPLTSAVAVAKYALRLLARRYLELRLEIESLELEIDRLVSVAAPALLNVFGLKGDGAATLLVSAGDNPDRLHSEAAFAALCGANPIPASSGKTQRHRLNRGGDRQANATLHRIVVVRLRWHAPTQTYMSRRLSEGKTKPEIMRCLKRYIAREVFAILRGPVAIPSTTGHLVQAA
jgi:transposase